MSDVKKPKYWMGLAPRACDIDQTPLQTKFVDGATTSGAWANMCLSCARRFGRGLGAGKGQEYTKQEDGRWLKTGG